MPRRLAASSQTAVRAIALLAALAAPAACGRAEGEKSAAAPRTSGDSPVPIGGPFELVDSAGKPFTDQDLRGRPFVVYFGYAFCPDVCPLALNQLQLALDMLGPDAERFQTVFITIDPERDTPEELAAYVKNYGFPKNLIGLTGTPAQIQAVARAYRVYYKKRQAEEDSELYLMDHSSVLYLMDAEGRFASVFTHGSTPEEIAAGLRRHIAGT